MEDKFLFSVIRQFLLLLLVVVIFIIVITHDLFSEQKYLHQPNTGSKHIGIMIGQPIYHSGAKNSQVRKVAWPKKSIKYVGLEEAANTEGINMNHNVAQTTQNEELSITANTDKPNILLVTYMRSGSTFLGDIIQQVPGVYYVYEPLRFYLSRSLEQYYYRKHSICSMHNDTCRLPTTDRETALRVLIDINKFYNCKFIELPKHFLRKKDKSVAVESLNMCLNKNYGNALYHNRKCVEEAMEKCNAGPRLIKTIRLSMGVASVLLKRVPKLKIILLLRDPRGLVNSRYRRFYDNTSNKTQVAIGICNQLLRDIELSLKLREDFPGQIKMILYENLAEHPQQVSMNLFSFLGIFPTSSFKNWLLDRTHNDEISDGYYGTSRFNSTETANHWRKRFPIRFAKLIDDACPKVYKYMGLKAVSDKDTLRNENISLRYQTNLFD